MRHDMTLDVRVALNPNTTNHTLSDVPQLSFTNCSLQMFQILHYSVELSKWKVSMSSRLCHDSEGKDGERPSIYFHFQSNGKHLCLAYYATCKEIEDIILLT